MVLWGVLPALFAARRRRVYRLPQAPALVGSGGGCIELSCSANCFGLLVDVK